MSFLDQSALQATSAMDKDPMQGAQQGVQAGVELAKAQQSWQMQRMTLQMKQQELAMQKTTHVAGLVDKAAEAYKSDPALGDALMGNAINVGQVLDNPLHPDFVQAFKKSGQFRDWYQKQLDGLDPTAPDYLQKRSQVVSEGYVDPSTGQKMPGLASVWGGQALQTAAENAAKPVVEMAKTNAMADAIGNRQVKGEVEKRKTNIVANAARNMSSGLATPEDLAAAASGNATPEQWARLTSSSADFESKDAKIKQDSIQAKTKEAETNTALAPKKEAETERHNRAMESMDRLRVKVSTSKEAEGIIGKAVSETKAERDGINELNKVDGLLVPGKTTVNQANLAVQGIERAMTHSARVASTMYQGTKLNDVVANFKKKLAEFGIGKPDDAVVPTGVIKNYQDVVKAMRTAGVQSIKEGASVHLQAGVKMGLIDKDQATQTISHLTDPKATQQFLDAIGYHEPVQQQQAQTQAGGGSGNLKKPSPAFLGVMKQRIPNVDARKKFIESQGFDSSGVSE